jgi:hypothetical protein
VTSSDGVVIASQRLVFGPSFGETMGVPDDSLAASNHWTWYDYASPGMQNWVLVANPNSNTIYYSIKIGGKVMPGYSNTALVPGGIVTPTFPGTMEGPVEVVADGDVIASQRVLYNGYFNEVLGTVLN